MLIKMRSVLAGIRSYSPFFSIRKYGAGATNDAYYCYQVWLGHLLRLHALGVPYRLDTVAELGPGDSLGVGIAALLTGTGKYVALDAVPYCDSGRNVAMVDEILDLLSQRVPLGRGKRKRGPSLLI